MAISRVGDARRRLTTNPAIFDDYFEVKKRHLTTNPGVFDDEYSDLGEIAGQRRIPLRSEYI